jgi:hypothetical protein
MIVGTLIAGLGLGWLIGRFLNLGRPPRVLQTVRVMRPQRQRRPE